MNLKSVPLDDVKILAKRLCAQTRDVPFPLTHSSALNVVSVMLGHRNYNTLRAQDSTSQKNKDAVEKVSSCSKIESFLSRVFELNQAQGKNIQSIYLPAFCAAQVKSTESSVVEALNSLGRHFVLVDARGKSECDIYRAIIGKSVKTTHQGWRETKERLLSANTVIVLSGISQSTISRKAGIVRSLIKTLDDAHFDGVTPEGNVIFIDSHSFLEKHWDTIGIYLAVSGPSYYMA